MSTKTRKSTKRTLSGGIEALTPEDLDRETQKICAGHFPGRTLEPDPSIPPEQRIRAAGQLVILYKKMGMPVPECLSAIA
jgi:hypothetical protein